MKQSFFGKYYKFISDNKTVFACIDSVANEGKMLQVITQGGSYLIDKEGTFSADETGATFAIFAEGLSIEGRLDFGPLHPLSTKVMGPFTYLPMECRHEIYSMFHTLNGTLRINQKELSFTDSPGYIEGDSGKSFPKQYIWYNSVSRAASATMAIATIPFGPIGFTGILCFVRTPEKEYRLCTYNGAKTLAISKEKIVIKRGKAVFTLTIGKGDEHDLKAPVVGNMDRYIKESITIPTHFTLTIDGQNVAETDDPISSLEYMWASADKGETD